MNNHRLQTIFYGLQPEAEGIHERERDIWGPFVWTRRCFTVRRSVEIDHYAVKLCYYGRHGKLIISDNARKEEFTLHKGWNTYPIDFSGFRGNRIEFELSHTVPVADDPRELGIMIRSFSPLENDSQRVGLQKVLSNKILNNTEYEKGLIQLISVPSKLRINTATQCTMKPPCVYCDWERTKKGENESDFKFGSDSLSAIGQFYTLADEIVDNSHGEPLLNRQFGSFLNTFEKSHKYFEVGSNGQLLSEVNRRMLLGKNVVVYVSADAASAEAYARYRDNKFDSLINNLRAICKERKMHREFPKIIMSFVAMRSNQNEIGPYMDLMKEVGVDGIKMIYLDPDPYLKQRVLIRNGFRFDYDAEVLSLSELQHLYDKAKQMAEEKGVQLITRLDFGAEEAAGEGPLCSEPWKNIHILDRGIVLCLFSRTTPVAKWSERGNRSIEQFLFDVWSGKQYQKIRTELGEGTLPELCRMSVSCPVVRKANNARQ